MKPLFAAALLAVVLASSAAASARQEELAVDGAAKAEISRALKMKESGYPSPYYVGITAIDFRLSQDWCVMGRPVYHEEEKQAFATTNVRVGGYAFDNHPLSVPADFIGRPVSLDDEFALRHGLWLNLDADYKSAAAGFLNNEALRATRGRAEYDTDDFSREPAQVRIEAQPPPPWDEDSLREICRDSGDIFRSEPGLLQADSRITAQYGWFRLRNSEGSRVDFGRSDVQLDLDAADMTKDGLKVQVSRRFLAASPQGLPGPAKISDAVRGMLRDLKDLKVAQTTSPFSAPALLDPSVSAAVILAIGERLSGEALRNPSGAQTFGGKVGSRFLPAGFSLIDDPTMASFGGTPLLGHYQFDDQGVPAQKTSLFRDGRLSGFLLSRYPVQGFARSNGHGRAFPGYPVQGFPGVLILKSSRTFGHQELLALLRRECRKRHKPYGLLAVRLRDFVQTQETSDEGSIRLMPELLYLVDAETGKETLVRNLDLVGTPLELLNSILRAGKDTQVQNMEDQAPVSIIVPSLLVSGIELQRSSQSPEKPPILPPPPNRPGLGPAAPPKRIVPTIPRTPYVEALRYEISGALAPVRGFKAPGLEKTRFSRARGRLIIDARLSGSDLLDLARNARALDALIFKLARGAQVDKSSLCPPLPAAAYRARFDDGWPAPEKP